MPEDLLLNQTQTRVLEQGATLSPEQAIAIPVDELKGVFQTGFDQLKQELLTISEGEDISAKTANSLAHVFGEAARVRNGRAMPEGEEKKQFSQWLIQGIGRAGADLSPAVREVLFNEFLKRTPAERVLAVLGIEVPVEGDQSATDRRVTHFLEKMAGLESAERSFLEPTDRSIWDAAFDDLRNGLKTPPLSAEDGKERARELVDLQMDAIKDNDLLVSAVGRDQLAAMEAIILKVDTLSVAAPGSLREEMLYRIAARLPEEVAFSLILKHNISFSLETRHRLIKKMVSKMTDPIAVLQDNPSFTEGMTTAEVIEDMADWSASTAMKLVQTLPHDEALVIVSHLAHSHPYLLGELPQNLNTQEDKKQIALAILEKKPGEFLTVARALGQHMEDVMNKKGAFVEYLVRDKDWETFSSDLAPFGYLQELAPLSEDECVQLAQMTVRTHLLNFESFLEKRLDMKTLEQIKAIPEAQRLRIVEAAVQAVSTPDPLLVARVSRYFRLGEQGLAEIQRRYPELAKTNYVNPEFGGILGGLALREYQESPQERVQDMGPDAEQVLSDTERIGAQLTDLMKQLVPERIPKEEQRATQEARLRRPIRYEADLGVGVASALVVVYEDNYEPAIYKPRVREPKEHGINHIPLRNGIHPGEAAVREWLAVQIDKVFQLDVVPPTILRAGSHGLGSVQKWEKGKMPGDPEAEAALTAANLMRIALFDVIAQNSDRHSGNFLVTQEGVVQGIDHGYILSRVSHGADGLRSHPLEKVQGMPIPKELRANIRLFKDSASLQAGLRAAFNLAFSGDEGSRVDQLWGEFMQRLDQLDPNDPAVDGVFPAPAYH